MHRSPNDRRALPWLLAIALLLLISGCDRTTTTHIKTILDDPEQFDRKQVQISGVATNSIGAPSDDAFEVDDGTGKIFVCSKEHGRPLEGTKVVVKGIFYAAISSPTQQFAAVVEQKR